MKKITIFLITALCTITICHSALADSYAYAPYIGADYVYGYINAKGITPRHQSASIRIGSDYSPYFSTEMFFAQSLSDKRHSEGLKIKTSNRSYGLDLVAYMPIDSQQKFSFLATAGIAEYVFKIREMPLKHHNEHGFGYRFGGGLKYKLDNHWQARFVSRYVKFDHVHDFNKAVETSVGIEYHF